MKVQKTIDYKNLPVRPPIGLTIIACLQGTQIKVKGLAAARKKWRVIV